MHARSMKGSGNGVLGGQKLLMQSVGLFWVNQIAGCLRIDLRMACQKETYRFADR